MNALAAEWTVRPFQRGLPVEEQELGCLKEGAGLEDEGDNLPCGIDGAFTV